jgi:lysine---8-amino-7-oxononanoate aminotransferase
MSREAASHSSLITHHSSLASDDKAYLWHPFTQMAEYADEEPLIVAAGEGSYLIDV